MPGPADPTWFHSFVERFRQGRSLPSVQEWVAAHDQPPPEKRLAKSAVPALYSARNDARSSAGASGRGVDISFPPGSSSINQYNIFANIALHDQAAATIVSASQRKAGFTATMSTADGVALNRFLLYLLDFIAPHWTLTYYEDQVVSHHSSNHAKFVNDLVAVVNKGLRAVGADNDSVRKAEETVRSLAQRLASNSSREEKLTLFSNFFLTRASTIDPVFYGTFYMTLHARYVKDGKTEVLDATAIAFSLVFGLVSEVLIANEKHYNELHKTSVDEWLAGHTI